MWHNSQLAHDCQRISSKIWKLNMLRMYPAELCRRCIRTRRLSRPSLQFCSDRLWLQNSTFLSANLFRIIETVANSIHTADVTQLDSCVTMAVCIGFYFITNSTCIHLHKIHCSQYSYSNILNWKYSWPEFLFFSHFRLVRSSVISSVLSGHKSSRCGLIKSLCRTSSTITGFLWHHCSSLTTHHLLMLLLTHPNRWTVTKKFRQVRIKKKQVTYNTEDD